jgi:autotransporter-associated beta strand protein
VIVDNHSYTGATIINGGVLQLGSSGGVQGNISANSAVSVSNGGTLKFVAISGTFANNITNGTAGLGTVNGGQLAGFTTALTGTLSDGAAGQLAFVQSGPGTTVLAGSNTYSGGTQVNAGVLLVNGSAGSGNVTVNSGGTLGGTGTISGLVTVNDGGILSPGPIGGVGTLEVGGLVLSSGATSSFTSGALVNDLGALTLGGSLHLSGSFAPGTYTLFDYSGTLTNNGLNVTNVPGGLSAQISAGSGVVNLVLSFPGGAQYWDGSGTPNDGTIAGGSGNWNTSTNNWTTSDGTVNSTWAGGTAIFAAPGGTVTLTSPISAQSLIFNGSELYTLSGTQTLTLAGSAPAIVTAVNTMSVTIGVPLAGSNGLTVSGPGTVTLTNSANSYTGGTTVNGSFLQIGTTPSVGSIGAGTVSVGNGGTLSIVNLPSPTISNNITNGMGGSGNVETSFNNFTFTGTLTDGAAGQLGFHSAVGGTIILANANNTFSGPTDINQSTLQIGTTSTPGSIGPNSAISISVAGFLTLVNVAGNVLENSINGPGLTGTVTVNSANANTLSGNITGAIAIIQSGTGATTLAGTDSYTKATTVSTGSLQIGNGSSGNLTGNSTVTVSNSSSLILDQPDGSTMKATIVLNGSGTTLRAIQSGNITVNGVISGAGQFVQAGSGTTALASAETYTGATTINAGTLEVDGSLAAGTTVNIGSNGTLSGSGTISGNVTVTGNANIKLNAGTISGMVASTGGNWTGIGTVNGAITSSAGTFTLGHGATLTSPAGLNITGGMLGGSGTLVGNLNYSSAATSTFSGLIEDGTNLSTVTLNNSSGTLILTAANLYSGVTNVTAGTLEVDNLLESGTVNIGTAGQLTGGGTIDGNVTMTGNGIINLGATGTIDDSLTLAGGNWNGLGSVLSPVITSGGTFSIGSGGNLTAPAGVSIGDGSLAGTGTITGSVNYMSGVNSTFGGVIADGTTSSSLTLDNASATLILTGANTYTGATTVSAGTLQIGNGTSGSLSASTTVDIQHGTFATNLPNNGTFGLNVSLDAADSFFSAIQSGTNTISGVISGAGSFNQNGTGTTVLNATDTYSGATNVNKGTLQIGDGTNGNLTGTSGIVVAAGATLALNLPDGTTFSPNIALNGATATLKAIQSTGTTQISGVISGAGTFNQNGGGTTELTAAETYTGPTNINAGDLQVDVSLAVGSTVNVASVGTLSGAGTINGNVTMTGNGVINLNAGAIGGTLTVTGGNWNGNGTVTGLISSNSGVFTLGVGSSLTGLAGLNITGGTLAGTGAILANVTYTSSASSTFGGNIGGTSTLVLNNAAATLTLTGANSSTNSITINAGTLQLAAGGSVQSSGITVSGTGVFGLGLSDTGTFDTPVSLNAVGASFKANNASGSQTILSVISGSGSFSQVGAGTTVIGSSANETYTGATNITAGTLEVDGSLAAASTVNVATGGTLSGSGTIGGNVTLSGNGTIDLTNPGIIGGTLTVTGGKWTGAGAVNGAVTVSSGAFNLTGDLRPAAGLVVNGGSLTGNGTLRGSLNYASSTGSTFAGVIEDGFTSASVTMNNSAATLILTGANLYNGPTTITAGTLQLGDGTTPNSSLGNGAITVSGTSTLVLDLSDGSVFHQNVTLGATGATFKTIQSGTTTISGVIGGSGSFNQNGSGTTVIQNGTTNTYTGATNVNAGTLQVDGSLAAASTVNVATGGTLSGSGTVNGKVTLTGNGTIDLTVPGSIGGTLTVTGGNWTGTGTVGGAVTVGSGAFNLGGTLTAPAGLAVTGGTLGGSGTLVGSLSYTSSSASTFAGDIVDGAASSSLTMNKAGSTLILAGANAYSGPTTITAGTLQVGNGTNASLGSGTVTVSGSSALALDLGGGDFFNNVLLNGTTTSVNAIDPVGFTQTIFGVISGSGSFNQNGPGTTVVANGTTDTYTGATNVNVGTLEVDGSLAAASNVSVVSARLTGSGIINGKVTLTGSGTIILTDPGTIVGTLAITGGNWNGMGTVDGAVTASSGVFNLLGTLTAPAGLAVTGGTFAGNGKLAGSLNYTSSASSTFIGVIADGASHSSVTMNKTGSTLILTGANTFSGPTTITAGTLQLGDGNAANTSLGSGAVSVSGTGVLALNLAMGSTFSQSVALGAAGATLKAIQSGTTTVSGIISGAGGFTQAGTGTTIVTATNDYSGATNVSAGVMQVDGTLNGNGAVTVNNGGTLAGAGTITGPVTLLSGGTLSVGDSGGPGTLNLSKLVLSAGSNSDFRLDKLGVIGGGSNDLVNVTGNLTIAGNLNITQLTNFGVGMYTLFTYGGALINNGFIAINGTGSTGFDAVVSTGTAHQVNLIISTSQAQSWDGTGVQNNGVISGGSGTWNGTNTNWTNASGTVNSAWGGGTAVFGTVGGTVTVGSPINVQGLIFGVTGYTLTGAAKAPLNLVGGPGSAPLISVTHASDTATIGAVISGIAGLGANGAGTLILTNAANTYTGGTFITAGTVQIGTSAVPGSLGSGVVAVTGGGLLDVVNIHNNVLSNAVSNGVGGDGTLEINSKLNNTISGQLTDGGADQLFLLQNGTGTTILTNPNNSYSGGTVVAKGTLQIGTSGKSGVAGSLGSAPVNLGAATTLSFVNVSGGIVTNNITNSSSGIALINVNSTQSLTASGVLSDGTPGILALTQSGTGTTILNGANNYSGATKVTAGTLQVGDGTTMGTTLGSTTVTVSGSGGLALDLADSGNFNNAVVLSSATSSFKSITGNTQMIGGVISGTGTFNQNGTGITVLDSGVTETYTGATNVNAGILEVDGTLAAGSTVHVASGATLRGTGTIKGNVTLTGNGTIGFGSGGNIGGALTVTGGNWTNLGTVTGAVTSSSGTFTVQSGAHLTAKAGLNVTGGTLAGSGEVDGKVTDTSSTSFTFGGVIGDGSIPGSGSLVMNKASATLTLTGTNTYTGLTTVTAGTLQVGDGSTTGTTLGTGTVTIGSGATLTLDLANNATFSNSITDTGHLVDSSSSGNNFTIASNIGGAGNFTKSGSNTVALTGTNTYGGGSTVSAGTLLVNNTSGSGTGTGAVTVGNGGTLGGGGKVGGAMTLSSGGTIAPGAGGSLADTTLHGSSLLWNGGGTITLELGATTNDELSLTGALTKGTAGTFTIDLLDDGIASQTSYTLLSFASTTFSLTNFNLVLPAGFAGNLFETGTSLSIINFHAVSGELPGARGELTSDASFSPSEESGAPMTTSNTTTSDLSQSQLTPTPEPGGATLLVLGAGTLLGWRRRSRKAK